MYYGEAVLGAMRITIFNRWSICPQSGVEASFNYVDWM